MPIGRPSPNPRPPRSDFDARAGWSIDTNVTVEVSDPTEPDLPGRATVVSVNGRDVTTRASWEAVTAALDDRNTFEDGNGRSYKFAGPSVPYRRVELVDRAPDDLDVVVGGRLARTVPGAWIRQLALGPSHGLMVALMSYVYASGDDLGVGWAIAAAGKVGGDGEVGSIGGLVAKATAARRVGADVLLFPAGQRAALDRFDPGSMQQCPVATLDEAIDALSRRAACGR